METKKTTKRPVKKLNSKNMIDAGKKPLLVLGGMFVGSLVGKQIDKMLKVDELPEGFNVKKLIRPLVLVGAGAAGSIMLKNDDLKLVATGVTASGVVSGVKVFLKKDILAGMGNAPQLTIEPYQPNLIELDGMPEEYAPEMRSEDFSEYQEVNF